MSDWKSEYNKLEDNVTALVFEYSKLKKERAMLVKTIESLKDKLEQSELDLEQVKEENKKLTMVSAMQGNTTNSRLVKLKLDRLIKEVDFCIHQIADL